jgi:hypothetical protein
MKKLRLEIEQLEVESFATAAGPEELRGTVRGLAEKTYFPQETCPMEYTPFYQSCDPADCQTMAQCPSFDLECPMLSSECTADPNEWGCGG